MTKDENVISLETAQNWAQKWRENPENTIKAYLIPNIDITQLQSKPDVVDFRAYLGIDNTGEHRLMIVGVDADGEDLIDSATGHYIYDFTKPCPTVCSTSSPLYTLLP